jgi:type IV pilus assembly protein PilA
MRTAFTLIELMIVIAIIAIIAAIAIPNLLESRVTSQESAAAAALKSGMTPAQVQFQAGTYSDIDNNGVGAYCVVGASGVTISPYDALSGQVAVGGVTLTFLPPSFRGALPTVSGYYFKSPSSSQGNPTATSDGDAERVWAVLCYPSDNNQGRRFFAINQAGNVYASKPSPNASTGAGANVSGSSSSVLDAKLFDVSLVGGPVTTFYLPYRR